MYSYRTLRTWMFCSARSVRGGTLQPGWHLRSKRSRLLLEVLEDRSTPAVLTVNTVADNTTDTTVLTLREAIALLNSGGAPSALGQASLPAGWQSQIDTTNPFGTTDTIDFKIAASAVQTIFLTSQLPTVSRPVVIDGTTEADWMPNTSDAIYNAQLTVVLDGTSAGASEALLIAGGNSTVKGLQIQNFTEGGIHLLSSGNDTVVGNSIQSTGGGYGSPNDPATVLGGGGGVYVDGVSGNVIGGGTLDARNELTYDWIGIQIAGASASNNQVLGNVIGTDGSTSMPFDSSLEFGVLVLNASANTIGGTATGDGNVIADEYGAGGIELIGDGIAATGNVIQGNFLGTNAAGTAVLTIPTNPYGPYFSTWGVGLDGEVVGTQIGGTTAGAGNVIAPEQLGGIEFTILTSGLWNTPPTGTVIENNKIGVSATGTSTLTGIPSDAMGIYDGSGDTTILGNAIAGCTSGGVTLQSQFSGSGDAIEGNFIYGNAGDGIDVRTFPNTTIQGNTIYDNTGSGIKVGGTNDRIEGNSIFGNGGLAIDLDSGNYSKLGSPLFLPVVPVGTTGASLSALTLTETGSSLSYGGTLTGQSNSAYVVRFDAFDGAYYGSYYSVLTTDSSGQVTFANLTFTNPSGFPTTPGPITPNVSVIAPHSPQIGNYGQNFPVLSAATSGSSSVVTGTLNGAADTTFTVDLYANPTVSASDYYQGQYYGEGQYDLGQVTVTTDANGNASFSADVSAASLPGGVLPSGWYVSATATDPNGNTSEYSADMVTALASQTLSQYLQTALPQNLSSPAPTAIDVQAGPDQSPAGVIQAVNGLTNVTQPVTVVLDLGGGTYSTGGVAANPPANVTFVVQNGTLDPVYPALTVSGGQVSVVNCTLTTSGNAPTLLITGGSVTLSNDTVVQSSTTSAEPAVAVTGGNLNLGTATSPGNNTLSVNSSGDLVSNTSGNPI
jgi:parallel beta-helix repeat protein